MNKIILKFSFLLLLLFVISGCEDRTDLTPPAALNPVNGSANLTRFVTLGNSLTAGYQSGSLYEGAQIYSYGNQIAGQVGANFVQPIVSEPGTPGRIEIVSLDPFSIKTMKGNGQPVNSAYAAPFNNLGIPGSVLFDMLDTTDFAAKSAARENPFFSLVLRSSALGNSVFNQAKNLRPTLLTCWIGNNDVLGYATSGGVKPTEPTSSAIFGALYTQLGSALASLGCQVAVANIPDVTVIPFFNTVGPQVAAVISQLPVPGVVYQKHGSSGIGVAPASGLASGSVLFTLTGSTYAALLGTPTGRWYRDNGYPALPTGIDTTKPFGFDPQNPWPDALVLDPDEITVAKQATTDFNSVISNVANANQFGLVDINAYLTNIKNSGSIMIDGLEFSNNYVEGGIFSLDGVHPTSQGQAILANEFIKVINSKFGGNVPLINVSTIPGSLSFAKKLKYKNGFAIYDKDAFKHLLY